jgi:hypothetical protein
MRAALCIAMALAISPVRNSHSIGPENRTLWRDDEDAAMFIAKLKERKIPFRRDAEGVIWYPASEVRTVDEIERLVAHRCGVGINFEDSRDATLFSEQLTRAGIPFASCRHFGKEFLVWDPRYDKEARAIQEEVEDESMRRGKEERARARDRVK